MTVVDIGSYLKGFSLSFKNLHWIFFKITYIFPNHVDPSQKFFHITINTLVQIPKIFKFIVSLYSVLYYSIGVSSPGELLICKGLANLVIFPLIDRSSVAHLNFWWSPISLFYLHCASNRVLLLDFFFLLQHTFFCWPNSRC